ncbi:MAG: hypothetical protein BAJATHORv1_30514 [Candidatus Thorarchaeota archaeon]|nr:MAG: hypothetical protein BAJATHORv1_30514 [Candidatus Thorarchaeota archaeon]
MTFNPTSSLTETVTSRTDLFELFEAFNPTSSLTETFFFNLIFDLNYIIFQPYF